jgi:hypothetical protein
MLGIGEASVQGKLSAYCPDLRRLLVVVPGTNRGPAMPRSRARLD